MPVEFDKGGKEVCDISADGINHTAQSAGVSTDDVEILEENDEFIMVKATAKYLDKIKSILFSAIVRSSISDLSGLSRLAVG